MPKKTSPSLRERAEMAMTVTRTQITQLPKGEAQQLLCELQLHQIELDIQNEDLRQTQIKLQASCDRYAELYDGAPVGYLTLDRHGQILEGNRLAAILLNETQSRLVGSRFERWIDPLDQPALRAHLQKAHQSGKQETVDLHLYRPGSAFCVVRCCTQMGQESKEALHTYKMTLSDETIRIQLEDTIAKQNSALQTLVTKRTKRIRSLLQQRAQSERFIALGQLAAGVAHEINNPLASLMSAFQLVKNAVPSTHPHAKYLPQMDGGFTRLVSIIRQMYQLYGQQQFRASPCRVVAIIEDAITLVRRKSEEQALTLHCTPFDPDLTLIVPIGPLVQVLANVLHNAVEASPVGGTITLDVQHTQDDLSILIRDEGPGIAHKELPRLFDPFYSSKRKSTQSGMGLGLSISKSLVHNIGGELSVASQVGVGSTFTVKIPIRSPIEEQVQPKPAPQSALPTHTTLRVLLVDDEQTFLEASQRLLCDAGYRCEAAHSIEDALDKLESRSVNLLISDISLPGNADMRFFHEVHTRWPQVPVVLLSGDPHARTRVEEAVPDLTISAFLTKPVTIDDMQATIDEEMGKKALEVLPPTES